MIIQLYPNKILNKKCTSVTQWNNDLYQLVKDLEFVLVDRNSIEISAPQLGTSLRVFSLFLNGKPVTFINPKIREFGKEKVRAIETCLSIPMVRLNSRKRYDRIVIESKDIYQKTTTTEFKDNNAIAIQHAIDHLNGILFFEHMKPWIRKSIIRAYKKQTKNNRDLLSKTIKDFKKENNSTLYNKFTD